MLSSWSFTFPAPLSFLAVFVSCTALIQKLLCFHQVKFISNTFLQQSTVIFFSLTCCGRYGKWSVGRWWRTSVFAVVFHYNSLRSRWPMIKIKKILAEGKISSSVFVIREDVFLNLATVFSINSENNKNTTIHLC